MSTAKTNPALERLRQIVAGLRARQSTIGGADLAWQAKLPWLFQTADALVKVFHEAGHNDLKLELRHNVILLTFGDRPIGMLPAGERFELVVEQGAAAAFLLWDGRVHGYRRPFHTLDLPATFEGFTDLGVPGKLQDAAFGNAIVDFLEWAAAGAGCGRKKLDFI